MRVVSNFTHRQKKREAKRSTVGQKKCFALSPLLANRASSSSSSDKWPLSTGRRLHANENELVLLVFTFLVAAAATSTKVHVRFGGGGGSGDGAGRQTLISCSPSRPQLLNWSECDLHQLQSLLLLCRSEASKGK